MKLSLSLILTLLCAGAASAEDDLANFRPAFYCDPVPDGRVIIEKDGRRETAGKQVTYYFPKNNGQEITTIFEERYIKMIDQKCAIKTLIPVKEFRKIFPPGLNEVLYSVDINDNEPSHGTFEEAHERGIRAVCYAKSLDELMSTFYKITIDGKIHRFNGPINNPPSKHESGGKYMDENIYGQKYDIYYNLYLNKNLNEDNDRKYYPKRNETLYTPRYDIYNSLNKLGFVGYYVTQEKINKYGCDGPMNLYIISGYYYLDGKIGILDESYKAETRAIRHE